MPHITVELLRKRAEHNEGMISSLEEVSLHQEELESINEVLGTNCRKLKILYLQNNIIPKIQCLRFCRDLEYLNLALNNISKIEGLQNCEFLNKLDVTLNFIDFDTLEESLKHLQRHEKLRDLYMMGNPSQSNWEGKFNHYVIAMLPQVERLDGVEITRSMQIQARQKLPDLQAELNELAAGVREEKRAKREAEAEAKAAEERTKTLYSDDAIEVEEIEEVNPVEAEIERNINDANEATENTPEAREEIYREMAQQKKEKQDREDANKPRKRDYEAEHKAKTEEIRRKEEETGERTVRQKNEGGWKFRWDETERGQITLEVCLNRHLDSSLIDVDVHPHYVSMVVKSKVLRLALPSEVRAGESKCQRSKTTGSLLVVMPLLNAQADIIGRRADEKHRAKQKQKENVDVAGGAAAAAVGGTGYIGGARADRSAPKRGSASGGGRTKFKGGKGPSIFEQMQAAAAGAAAGGSSGEAEAHDTKESKSKRTGPGDSTFDIDAEIEKLDIGASGSGTGSGKIDLANIAKGPNSRAGAEKAAAAEPEVQLMVEEIKAPPSLDGAVQNQKITVLEAGADGAFEI